MVFALAWRRDLHLFSQHFVMRIHQHRTPKISGHANLLEWPIIQFLEHTHFMVNLHFVVAFSFIYTYIDIFRFCYSLCLSWSAWIFTFSLCHLIIICNLGFFHMNINHIVCANYGFHFNIWRVFRPLLWFHSYIYNITFIIYQFIVLHFPEYHLVLHHRPPHSSVISNCAIWAKIMNQKNLKSNWRGRVSLLPFIVPSPRSTHFIRAKQLDRMLPSSLLEISR